MNHSLLVFECETNTYRNTYNSCVNILKKSGHFENVFYNVGVDRVKEIPSNLITEIGGSNFLYPRIK